MKVEKKDDGTVLVSMTKVEAFLVSDALDSHVYWQLSEEQYRSDGYVQEPGADDPEVAEEIAEARALAAAFEEASR